MGNVLINGRTAVHAGSGGTLTTVDVCLTKVGKPVVPIPYTNVAKSSDAAKTAGSVMINGHPVCTKSSVFSKSTGDEPGDRKGISSGTIQGKAEFISASANVMIEGVSAARQGDMMVSNNKNTPPAPLAQAGASKPPRLDVGEAQQLNASEAPHKLALELAGAELAGLKGSLIAEGPHLAELPLSRISDSDGRRYQLFFNSLPEGEYDLSLYYPDSRHGAYKLPFAQGLSTCAKDKQSAAWDTVLVPVVPRCYTTAEPQRAQANYLRHEEGGWLYIFANGHLWRELKVEKEGSFRDVNLTYTKGLDHRDATVSLTDSRIVVPHRINGEPVTLEMAYSEVQWSWARIDAMGGMAKEDPRQDQGQQVPSGQAPDQAAQNRTARMQTIDLSGYPQGFNATVGPVGPSNEFPPQERWDLALHQNSQIAVVYLQDPIGIAKGLAGELFACLQDYKGEQALAMAKAGTKYTMADMVHQMAIKSEDIAQYVDLDEIKELLHLEPQEKKLRAAENAAVALGKYLNRKASPGQPNISIVMQDYEEQSDPKRLLKSYSLTGEFVENLALGEGRKHLENCLQAEENFLRKALIPAKEKLETLVKFDVNAIAKFIESLAGSTQADEGARVLVFTFIKRVVEHLTSDSHTLLSSTFDLGPVLAGAVSQGAKGGYLHNSYFHIVRTRIDVEQWVVVEKANLNALQATLGKSVEWLRQHQKLVKANAIRLFAVLETINLGNAVREYNKSKKAEKVFSAVGSTANLISLGVQYLKDVRNVGAGWDDLALSKAKRDALQVKRIKITALTHGPALIGNVIALALAWNEAWDQYKRGDAGSAAAGTVSALGTTIMATAATLEGTVEMHMLGARGFQGALVSRVAQWGGSKIQLTRLGKGLQVTRATGGTLIGLAVGLAGALLSFCFNKSPLQQFLIHGPFGKVKSKRYHGDDEFESWKDDEVAEATLFNLLFSPRIEYRFMQPRLLEKSDLELQIHLPMLIEGKTRVDFELYGFGVKTLKPENKQIIKCTSEVKLEITPDGSYMLKVIYPPEAIKNFHPYLARVLLDLYGDGTMLLPIKNKAGKIESATAVEREFPEALLL